jgi:hypothetical protein
VRAFVTLADAFCDALRDDGWSIERDGGNPTEVRTAFAGTAATWQCSARVFEQQGQIVFDSVLPLTAPPDRRPDVCYLLTRLNWEIITGAFVLEADTGELRFRTSLLVPEAMALPSPAVLGMVYSNVVTVDRCLSDLASMLDADASLEDTLGHMGL